MMAFELRMVSEAGQSIEESEPSLHREGVRPEEEHPEEQPQILAELVIEEVGIDGMCGVY